MTGVATPNATRGRAAQAAGDPAVQDTDENLPRFMNVRQVARYLHLNEKKVYALAIEGKLPATKITGKWLFPRDLIDQWLLESSHGGLLADRLVITGSDDPLVQRVVMQLAVEIQTQALVSYTCTGTQLGLSLLARRRADVCAIHWGPVAESRQRHPALLRQHPQHTEWTLVRVFQREQGLIVGPRLHHPAVESLFSRETRWAMRQEGAGSQRFLQEILARHDVNPANLHVTARAYSEREAASLVAMDQADVAPGARSAAAECGLDFLPIGWEGFDFALPRGVYFRDLFQRLLERLRAPECQALAQRLGGYDLADSGQMIWSG